MCITFGTRFMLTEQSKVSLIKWFRNSTYHSISFAYLDKCPSYKNSLILCPYSIYHNKHRTIRRWDNHFVDPSFHRITLCIPNLTLRWTAWPPNKLNKIDALGINWSYPPGQWPNPEIFEEKFESLAELKKDGSKFWWLPWFPAKNNSCRNICNTVYLFNNKCV